MSPVRAKDLPKAVQERLAGLDGAPARHPSNRSKRDRSGMSPNDPCPGRCHTCGVECPTFAAWERHAGPGHRRWELALPADQDRSP